MDVPDLMANDWFQVIDVWWLLHKYIDGRYAGWSEKYTEDVISLHAERRLWCWLRGLWCVCDVLAVCFNVSDGRIFTFLHPFIDSSIDWLIDWLIDRSIDSWIQLATTTGTKAIRDLWWRGVVRGGRTGALDERRGFCGRTVFFVWAGATTATGLGCWCVFDVVCELGWRGLALDWVRLRSAATRCSDLPLASRSTSWRNWRSVVIIRFLPSDTTHRSRSRASKYLMTARLSCTSEVA